MPKYCIILFILCVSTILVNKDDQKKKMRKITDVMSCGNILLMILLSLKPMACVKRKRIM